MTLQFFDSRWPVAHVCFEGRDRQGQGGVSGFPHALEGRGPEIPILKQAKAEYAKLQ